MTIAYIKKHTLLHLVFIACLLGACALDTQLPHPEINKEIPVPGPGEEIEESLGSTHNPPSKMTLDKVRFWAYNIQDVNTREQHDVLVGTHFDMYVLEPVVTEMGEEEFNISGLVEEIRQHNIATRGVDPIILAYIDVGQAETWRWYWDSSWSVGDPEWIVGEDPDGWEGNLPVAYWDPTWEDIVIYGYKGMSQVEFTLQAGFDGIYMDWIEAFSDENVIHHAKRNGVDTADAMFTFIDKIRTYARTESPNANPQYLIIAQNASDLYEENPSHYRSLIDAIALEAIWYDGEGGFDDWDDPAGFNELTNNLYPGWTEEVLEDVLQIKAEMPVFCVEYAQDVGEDTTGSDAYQLAHEYGLIPTVSRRSLSRLSTSPYPPGYMPLDY